jgi:sugar lactone lactonase YvrE
MLTHQVTLGAASLDLLFDPFTSWMDAVTESETRRNFDGTPEMVVTGFNFLEGPRWYDGALWFSDMLGQRVMRLRTTGDVDVVAELDDSPSGLGFLPDGALLIVSMWHRLILRHSHGALAVHADLTDVPCDWLNDMVVAADGTAYVGTRTARDDPESPADTLVRVSPDGSHSIAARDLTTPNGAVISSGRLIVAETYGHRLTEYALDPEGGLTSRRTFAEVGNDFPDGICIDADGGVWFGTPYTGDFVRVDSKGTITDRLTLPAGVSVACALGGTDGRTLYMLSADPQVLHRSWSEEEQAFIANPDRPIDSGTIHTIRVRIPSAD